MWVSLQIYVHYFVVVPLGEKEVELTDLITKDGKVKKRKVTKKQLTPDEVKEKLRKLRGL